MYKTIKIICDKEVPVKHLLNAVDYEIYEAIGNEDIFTMVEKEKKEECGKMILTPHYYNGHGGGMWCAEKKPCKFHDKPQPKLGAEKTQFVIDTIKEITKDKLTWREEFDKEFVSFGEIIETIGYTSLRAKLKQFIAQVEKDAVDRERGMKIINYDECNYDQGVKSERNRIMKMCEGMLGELVPSGHHIRRQTLEDIINKI